MTYDNEIILECLSKLEVLWDSNIRLKPLEVELAMHIEIADWEDIKVYEITDYNSAVYLCQILKEYADSVNIILKNETELIGYLNSLDPPMYNDTIGLYIPEWMFFDPLYLREKEFEIIAAESRNVFDGLDLSVLNDFEKDRVIIWEQFISSLNISSIKTNNMITQSMPVFVSERLKGTGLDKFFTYTLNSFLGELNLLHKHYYEYPEKPEREDDIFMVIERCWLGIFNNAIKRSMPEVSTMQEFIVRDNTDKIIGRCDFLVHLDYWEKPYDLIFEVKNYESDGKWDNKDSGNFYKPIIEQVSKYYEAERPFYKYNTKLVCLVFEWVRTDEIWKKLNPILPFVDLEDRFTDFLCVYKGNEKGVIVYGHVFDAA